MPFTPVADPTQNPRRRTRAFDITQLAKATKQAQRGGVAGSPQSLPSSSTKPPTRPHPPVNRPSPSNSQSSSATASVKPDLSQASTASIPDAKQGSFTEFMIFSSEPSDMKFSVLTFKPPNLNTVISFPDQFQQPIKLNRKQPKSMLYAPPPNLSPESFVPVKPMLGPDGKPVYGPDGKIIMVNAEGHTAATVAKLAAKQNAKGKGKAVNGAAEGTAGAAKKKANNRPKTKQTFKASEETRIKRKEEYHPWVLEDASGNQEWIGRMDAKNDDGVWGLFMVDSNSGKFQFRPVHRFYNFVDRRQYVASQRADDVNEAIAKKKTINIVSEFTRRGGGSQATMAFAQRVERDRASANIKPKTEPSSDLFDDEDQKPTMGAEGDLDEMEWEEEMADDEEDHQHEEMAPDEEDRRTKERQKHEWKAANKLRDAHVDESDDDEDFLDLLSGEGKRMKNSLKKMNKEYEDDSEDEDDPYGKRYGSDVKEEEPESELLIGVRQQSAPPPPPPSTNPPIPSINLPPKPKAALPPVQPSGPVVPPPRSGSIKPGSRATSPIPGAGQALVAMRATSPHRPFSRTSSPFAPKPASRATSPSQTPARAASPAASVAAQSISSTNASTPRVPDKKRKSPFEEPPHSSPATSSNPAVNGASGEAKPKKKIHKTDVPEPTTEVLISFLKTMPNYTATSGQVSDRFGGKKWKAKLLELLKPIIDLGYGENGVRTVTLKPELR